MNETFTFNGINSGDYGVFIGGDAVYNAPARVVEMVAVPGRNGALAMDEGRYENIEVTYPAFLADTTQAEFASRVSELRNALCSVTGYQRLVDDYNPNEYRLAVYKSGLEVSPTQYNRAGGFDITFECKPQRFLVSGEDEWTGGEWGETKTVTGDIVTLTASASDAVKTLSVTLEPQQEGSGTPSPDNVRPISGTDEVRVYVAPTQDESQAVTYTTDLGQTVYGGTLDVTSGVLTVDRAMVTFDGTEANWSFTTVSDASNPRNRVIKAYFTDARSGYVTDLVGNYIEGDETAHPSTPNPWCAVINASGNLIIGVPTTITSLAEWKTFLGTNPLQIVYPLSTPQTYQLTPSEVTLLVGENVLWSNGDSITVEYGMDPFIIENPTRFASSPLLKVTGTGTVGIGSYSFTLEGTSEQTVYIDCEVMEAWTLAGTAKVNANDLVQYAGNEFPKLDPGLNTVSLGSGISEVVITPRWWKL